MTICGTAVYLAPGVYTSLPVRQSRGQSLLEIQFGDDSDESCGDGRGSSSASTVVIAYDAEPQDGGVGESAGSVLGVVAARPRKTSLGVACQCCQGHDGAGRKKHSAEQRTAKRNRTVTDV